MDWNLQFDTCDSESCVTPCVGVWIEINMLSGSCMTASVTPCVGVWIEIFCRAFWCSIATSLPAWECGLKLRRNVLAPHLSGHSLRGSVDWNFGKPYYSIFRITSLPAWECGLKCFCHKEQHSTDGSLPAWECGLKYSGYWFQKLHLRHFLRGSVDWNLILAIHLIHVYCHSLRGSMD